MTYVSENARETVRRKSAGFRAFAAVSWDNSHNVPGGNLAMRPSLHPVRMTYYEAPDLAEEVRALAAELRVTVAQAQRLINRKGIAALGEAA